MKKPVLTLVKIGFVSLLAFAGYTMWRDLGLRREIWHEVTN